MTDISTTVIAFAGGLMMILAMLAWFVFLPSVGLLWLLGWLA